MDKKVKDWLKRYGPAEIVSLVVTIAATLISYAHNHNRVSTALIGTWLGGIAYFAYIITCDIFVTYKKLLDNGLTYTFITFLKNIRALVAEFGFAELLDSFLVRPAFMYYLPILIGNMFMGSVVAKFAADIIFYIPAIIGYELSKSRFRKFH